MRIIYFIMRFILKLTLWVYYPRFKSVNKPTKAFSRTIFMSNHAASFMDPLAVVGSQSPIIFFMTRSDVFRPFLRPFLWASHMLPIYRKHDGEDTKKKNEDVFRKCSRILDYGRGLIVFSEGFTDNDFIRRLKPIKKGAVRIGFIALEDIKWKKKIYLQAVGANYSNPNKIGSDCVVSNGTPVCLNDYKERYLADSSKTILELTHRMEQEMRDQITDVRNVKMAPFHEHIMRITRKGMNAVDSDFKIPLLKRWEYSRNLAKWFNAQNVEEKEELMQLKCRLEKYFEELKKVNIEETPLDNVLTNKRRKTRDYLYMILLAPIMILGMIHCYLPYRFIKNFVEKSFKRKVFWGSVKMLLGFCAIGLFNILVIIFLTKLFDWSTAVGILYFFSVPLLTGLIAYKWFKVYKMNKQMYVISKMDVSSIALERKCIQDEIERLIPVA